MQGGVGIVGWDDGWGSRALLMLQVGLQLQTVKAQQILSMSEQQGVTGDTGTTSERAHTCACTYTHK